MEGSKDEETAHEQEEGGENSLVTHRFVSFQREPIRTW
jgi:hypothetical protein